MKTVMDKMLEHAYKKEYFQTASPQRIWDKARYATLTKKKRNFVPVLACVAGVALMLVAVPPVRAAVQDFFTSVGQYMSTPQEQRPKVEDVPIQTPKNQEMQVVETDAPPQEVPAAIGLPENWADQIKIEIKEALYDGEKVYLTYTIDGSALGLNAFKDLGGNMPYGENAYKPVFVGSNVALGNEPLENSAVGYEWSVENNGGFITATSEYTGEMLSGLSDDQQMTLYLQIPQGVASPELATEAGHPYPFNYNKQFAVSFTINAQNKMKVFGEQVYEINGFPVTFRKVIFKPTEIAIDVFAPSSPEWQELHRKSNDIFEKYKDDPAMMESESARLLEEYAQSNVDEFAFEIDFHVFADGQEITTPGAAGFMEFMTQDFTGYTGRFSIPFPQSGIRQLTLVPYNTTTGEEYTADKIVIDC